MYSICGHFQSEQHSREEQRGPAGAGTEIHKELQRSRNAISENIQRI